MPVPVLRSLPWWRRLLLLLSFQLACIRSGYANKHHKFRGKMLSPDNFTASWYPISLESRAEQMRMPPTARIYYKTLDTSVEDLEACFQERFRRQIFQERGKLKDVRGYLPEDLGEYYLHQQVMAHGHLVPSVELANVVIVNTLPTVSLAVIGLCNNVNHDNRQKAVFQWMTENLELLKQRHTIFACTSWTCQFAVTPSGADVLNEANATLLINELNGNWMPVHKDSWTPNPCSKTEAHKHHQGGKQLKAMRRLSRCTGHERNASRIMYGLPIPYSINHNIPRTVGGNIAKDIKFFFAGSLRAERVRHVLGQLGREDDVLLQVTGVELSDRPKGRKQSNLIDPASGRSYADLMQSDELCFVPRGDTPTSRRLFDAIISGCLPVIISDSIDVHLPFSSSIPYTEFTYRIADEEWIEDPQAVLRRLRAVDASELQRRRTIMAKYAPYTDWLAGTNVLSLIVKDTMNGRQRLINQPN